MKLLKNSQIPSAKVEIPSFSRIAWRKGNQDNAQLLQRWAEEFNRAELSTVVNRVRDCGIYLVEEAKYQEECFNFNKIGLIFLPIQKVRRAPGLLQSSSPSEANYFIQCAVSYSEEKAQKLVECLQSGGAGCTAKIGKLLGYPSCCIDFLSKYSGGKEAMDPIFISAKRTKEAIISRKKVPDGRRIPKKVEAETVFVEAFPETNVILRSFGVKTIPHIPCSFVCKKSQEISKKFLQFMPSKNSLLKFLAEPITWNEYKGVAIIDTEWFRGATQSIFHDDKIHNIINFNKNV